jgi:hypothetical protein
LGYRDSVGRNCKRGSAWPGAEREESSLQLFAVGGGAVVGGAVPAPEANAFPQAGMAVLHERCRSPQDVRRGGNVHCRTMHEVSRDSSVPGELGNFLYVAGPPHASNRVFRYRG